MSENTYVISINGDRGTLPNDDNRGPAVPPMRVVNLDANAIYITGSAGQNVAQKIQSIASSARPLYLDPIPGTEDDYVISVGTSAPFVPNN